MHNQFRENRRKIQQYFVKNEVSYLTKLTQEDLPVVLIEDRNEEGSQKLREVIIEGIPLAENAECWQLDMESERHFYAAAPYIKPVDGCLLFFTAQSLYVVLIEMKQTIKSTEDNDGLAAIQEKFQHSVGRVQIFLSAFIFDNSYNEMDIRYKCMVAYNIDSTNVMLENGDLKAILDGDETRLTLQDDLYGSLLVDFYFFQNTNPQDSPEEMEIDLDQEFAGDTDHEYNFRYTVYGAKGFPELTSESEVVQIALKMKLDGVPEEKIAAYTNLLPTDIQKL